MGSGSRRGAVGREAWPDNESTRRAKLAARTARGRVATHQHTQQPGTTGVEGAGGSGGHGRASRRRTQPHTATRRRRRGGRRRCGGCRRDPWAWLRCPWAVAGPGRASSRRAERSSRRGRLAGGPPPTGTTSSPARQHTTRRHTKHSTGARARRPAPLDATTQTRQLRNTDVPCRSARAAHRSRRSSRSPRLRRRAGPRR